MLITETEVIPMNLSNLITQMITEILENNEYTDIRRNELAQTIGCVPSQINYVIASRFTPEHGYLVESRRGGGGYIRIYRSYAQPGDMLLAAISAAGDTLDEAACRSHILSLVSVKAITADQARLIAAACTGSFYRALDLMSRDTFRAAVFKQMLSAVRQINNTDSSAQQQE